MGHTAQTQAQLVFNGAPLPEDILGGLTDTDPALPAQEHQARLAQDGYLLLRDVLDRNLVLEAGHEVKRRLGAGGFLDVTRPVEDGVPARSVRRAFAPELARDNPQLERVLYSGAMMDFFTRFFGGPVRHFDYTWLRAKTPGPDTATSPHYDIVYMGRGTKRLLSAWTPLHDVPRRMGGLMVLEGSHRLEELKRTYGAIDVDTYCSNHPDAAEIESGAKMWQERVNDGSYRTDALQAREELGGRWLTTDYRAGDLLVFTMYTMHASSDNQSEAFRLSTDTRYQLASEPVDPRWVGSTPIAHGPAGKRGMIC